jgi:hypothetical protein
VSDFISSPQLNRSCAHAPQKIEEQRITIEDLESLKELNDELEENHLETEKALQEEIGEIIVLSSNSGLIAGSRCQGHEGS